MDRVYLHLSLLSVPHVTSIFDHFKTNCVTPANNVLPSLQLCPLSVCTEDFIIHSEQNLITSEGTSPHQWCLPILPSIMLSSSLGHTVYLLQLSSSYTPIVNRSLRLLLSVFQSSWMCCLQTTLPVCVTEELFGWKIVWLQAVLIHLSAAFRLSFYCCGSENMSDFVIKHRDVKIWTEKQDKLTNSLTPRQLHFSKEK